MLLKRYQKTLYSGTSPIIISAHASCAARFSNYLLLSLTGVGTTGPKQRLPWPSLDANPWTLCGATLKRSAMRWRKRDVSRIVPADTMRCFGQPVIFHVTHARMSHGLLTITSTASGLYLITCDNRTHTLTSPILLRVPMGSVGRGTETVKERVEDNNINNFNSQSLECNVRRATGDHKCTRRAVKTRVTG